MSLLIALSKVLMRKWGDGISIRKEKGDLSKYFLQVTQENWLEREENLEDNLFSF